MFADEGADDVAVEAFPDRVVVVLAEPVRRVTVSVGVVRVAADLVVLSVNTELVLSERDARPTVSCVRWDEKD